VVTEVLDPGRHHDEINGLGRNGNPVGHIAYDLLVEIGIAADLPGVDVDADEMDVVPLLVIIGKMPAFPRTAIEHAMHLGVGEQQSAKLSIHSEDIGLMHVRGRETAAQRPIELDEPGREPHGIAPILLVFGWSRADGVPSHTTRLATYMRTLGLSR